MLNDAWRSDPEWGLLLWLTMLTGSRRGEVSALRWEYLDAERGVLTVEYSNAKGRAGLHEKRTKSRQQRRIALDAGTVNSWQPTGRFGSMRASSSTQSSSRRRSCSPSPPTA